MHKLEAAERLFGEAGNMAGAREAGRVKDQAQQKVRHSITVAFAVMLKWKLSGHGDVSNEPASKKRKTYLQ